MLAPLVALLLAAAPTGTTYTADAAASTIRYHIVHKLHKVEGVSHVVEGKAIVQPDGKVLAMLRAPIASFESGDGNRDSHMQEAMDVGKFPYVVLKAVSQLGGAVAASTATKTVTLDLTGELELHGVRRPVSMPVTLEMKADGTARAHGSFDVSLDAHQIERPSLLFVKVDDACRIEFDISFRGGKT